MEDLTIDFCKNNVCIYLIKIQNMQNEIDSFQKDGIKHDKQRFLTIIFDELGKTAGNLPANVKHQCSKWVKNPSAFNTITFIYDMINLYTN